MAHKPSILVCGGSAATQAVVEHLRRLGPANVITSGPRGSSGSASQVVDVVVLTETPGGDLVAACRQTRREFGPYTPVLAAVPAHERESGLRCLKEAADGLQIGLADPNELAARVQALLRDRRRHDDLQRECARLERERQHIALVHARINDELALAEKLQRSFLPRHLPELGAVRFAAHLLAVGPVAGDIYDVARLDEHTIGFYVADAVGHGVAAALLTAFVKKAVRPKIINGKRYRILPPGEVLTHLNREMLSAQLHESSFVTMAYGTIDVRTHVLRYSLAGHPPGICMREDGEQEYLAEGGPLLGVMDGQYRTQAVAMEPGDKVVIYSDGIDEARHQSGEEGPRALWLGVQKHARLPVDQLLERTLRDILPNPRHNTLQDDLTVMGVEVLRHVTRKEA